MGACSAKPAQSTVATQTETNPAAANNPDQTNQPINASDVQITIPHSNHNINASNGAGSRRPSVKLPGPIIQDPDGQTIEIPEEVRSPRLIYKGHTVIAANSDTAGLEPFSPGPTEEKRVKFSPKPLILDDTEDNKTNLNNDQLEEVLSPQIIPSELDVRSPRPHAHHDQHHVLPHPVLPLIQPTFHEGIHFEHPTVPTHTIAESLLDCRSPRGQLDVNPSAHGDITPVTLPQASLHSSIPPLEANNEAGHTRTRTPLEVVAVVNDPFDVRSPRPVLAVAEGLPEPFSPAITVQTALGGANNSNNNLNSSSNPPHRLSRNFNVGETIAEEGAPDEILSPAVLDESIDPRSPRAQLEATLINPGLEPFSPAIPAEFDVRSPRPVSRPISRAPSRPMSRRGSLGNSSAAGAPGSNGLIVQNDVFDVRSPRPMMVTDSNNNLQPFSPGSGNSVGSNNDKLVFHHSRQSSNNVTSSHNRNRSGASSPPNELLHHANSTDAFSARSNSTSHSPERSSRVSQHFTFGLSSSGEPSRAASKVSSRVNSKRPTPIHSRKNSINSAMPKSANVSPKYSAAISNTLQVNNERAANLNQNTVRAQPSVGSLLLIQTTLPASKSSPDSSYSKTPNSGAIAIHEDMSPILANNSLAHNMIKALSDKRLSFNSRDQHVSSILSAINSHSTPAEATAAVTNPSVINASQDSSKENINETAQTVSPIIISNSSAASDPANETS
jgi:hypothetical protein